MCERVRHEPVGALASSAARWRTPKRCCSSTTTSAELAELHAGLDERVRADRRAGARPRQAAEDARAGAPRASSRSAARRQRPPSSRSSVRWCCSASVSVGAISAAWAPFSTARSIACSATTVLPLPTSPISSRCIGRSRREVGVDLAARARSGPRSARTAATSASGRPPRRAASSGRARRPPRRARLRARHRQLEQEQLLEGEPARAPARPSSWSGKCDGGERGRAIGQRLRTRSAPAAARRGEHARRGPPHSSRSRRR